MKVLEYLKPENAIATWVVYILVAIFLFWFGSLLWSLWQHLRYRAEIKHSANVDNLRQPLANQYTERKFLVSSDDNQESFESFRADNHLRSNSPITALLRAIFDAGISESQLDSRALLKNTTDRIFRINSLHRSLLSIFIVLGLLGTLFGLADTMSSLAGLLRETSQLNNATLNQGLQRLLGTLKGAFAPSIWGVCLTVSGVLLYSAYLRFVALPLAERLERVTLTVWIPQLVPTVSQRLLETLQLSEQQMQRSFEAAQDVAKFASEIRDETGDFSKTISETGRTLKQMSVVTSSLEAFSTNFVEGVRMLAPFQQDLRTLYQQMLDDSRAFQETVNHNIAGSQEFQKHIQEQLNSQHRRTAELLKALQSYEDAYITNRTRIDEGLTGLLDEARKAYNALGQRNEQITVALDEALGKPLRADLTRDLNVVNTTLQERLKEVQDTLEVRLASVAQGVRVLDQPLNAAAKEFTRTFSNFDANAREWFTTIQKEFARQNESSQRQLKRLETLNDQLPGLLDQFTASSKNFSETSAIFATHGHELNQNTRSLSESIAKLGNDVANLATQVGEPNSDGNRAAELLTEQAELSQELIKRLEHARNQR